MTTQGDIVFFCNFCGQKITLHESREGTTVECPACLRFIPVPRREDLGSPPAKHPTPNSAKRITVPSSTRKVTVPKGTSLDGTQPHAPAAAAVPPASSSGGGIPLRNRKWLVIPVLAGLAIVGAIAIFQRPQQPPSSGAKVKLPVIDENRKNTATPKERVESKTPPSADSADSRLVIPVERNNLLVNGSLSGKGLAPTGWSCWYDENHDTDNRIYRSAGSSWNFWRDSGIYQDVTSGFSGGGPLAFGGYLYTPSPDALRDGTKYGIIQLEFYNGDTLISTHSALPKVNANSPKDTWILSQGTATVPANATKARIVVRCNDWTSGDGVFRADDVFLGKY